MVDDAIAALVSYALEHGLIESGEEIWAVNALLAVMQADSFDADRLKTVDGSKTNLAEILEQLVEDAAARGIVQRESIVSRDLFDTKLMGAITPRPAHVRQWFAQRYQNAPQQATDWYYAFSQDTNYIRRDRSAKDMRWQVETEYGQLDITINLAKPEKDPVAIAKALELPAANYPKCALCAENEGYAGRLNHPARQNHRVIPLTIAGEHWYFQYSPYVYYNEHCILFNEKHVPMKIDEHCFAKLLDFVGQFPHYIAGSNADLPIVGGSILTHDHFQGGRYSFAMERAPIETSFVFPDFTDITAGVVRWPASVIRLTGENPERMVCLATKILTCWRAYTDEEAQIFAETDGAPHNTITPIARRRGSAYELDLVLRNNLTTEEHPMGLYHPHKELHHIKRENIGLIEIMGLAVLPARLKDEMEQLSAVIQSEGDPMEYAELEKHAQWCIELKKKYVFTADNVDGILKKEIGRVFMQVLEHAGVFKRSQAGQKAFLRFLTRIGT